MKNKILLPLVVLVLLLSNCKKKSNTKSTSSSTSTTTTGGSASSTTADLTFIVKYKCPGTSSFQIASAKVVQIYDGLTNFNSGNTYFYQPTSGTGITTFTSLPLKLFYYRVGWSSSACGGVGSYYFSMSGNINLSSAKGYTVVLNAI
jgi:hypothetical protein